jgi:hypothetical protein
MSNENILAERLFNDPNRIPIGEVAKFISDYTRGPPKRPDEANH